MNLPLPRDFSRLHDSAADGVGPGRLWSLWDMLKFRAESFYRVALDMHQAQILVEERSRVAGGSDTPISDPESLRVMTKRARSLQEHVKQLGANTTASVIGEHIWQLESNIAPSADEMVQSYKMISKTLEHELKTIGLFVVEADRRRYCDPEEPLFGSNFDAKFASCVFEVDEAAKCLAFGRPTATVFHLMRVLEIGIRSIARCLGVPDPVKPVERSWGEILKAVKRGIDAKWPNNSLRMSGDGALFEDLLASLDAVKNPWRNATMHVENKYTDDEAEHIFVAVKGFMKKLASRCDEQGKPEA